MSADISIYQLNNKRGYANAPYHPIKIYPEFSSLSHVNEIGENEAYEAVRTIFFDLGYDQENFGKINWNPLKDLIEDDYRIFLKPNLVFNEHPMGKDTVKSMVTSAAVLRPIIDYILLTGKKNIKITIGDAPIQGADFDKVVNCSGIDQLISYYKSMGIEIDLLDLRQIITTRDENGILNERFYNPSRNDKMYTYVDLKDKSELYNVIDKSKKFTITDYKDGSVYKHHNKQKNEYLIPNEILQSNLFINIPKLKTHRKAGLTCAMKNLVGINGDKTCIAHHTKGFHNGDEFSNFSVKTFLRTRIWGFLKSNKLGIKIAGLIKRFFQKYIWKGKTLNEHSMSTPPSVMSEGSWHGNDTIWRCVKDINKIIFYADSKGDMQKIKQRKYLCIVDGVLAGEGEGPMEQTTKNFGTVFGGENPVHVDFIASKLMMFDYLCIPTIYNAFESKDFPLTAKKPGDITFNSNKPLEDIQMYFTPSFGWRKKLLMTQEKHYD